MKVYVLALGTVLATSCNIGEQFALTCSATQLELSTKNSDNVDEVCKELFKSTTERYRVELRSDDSVESCTLGFETDPLSDRSITVQYDDDCLTQDGTSFESEIHITKLIKNEQNIDEDIVVTAPIPISCNAADSFVVSQSDVTISDESPNISSLHGVIEPSNPYLDIYGRNQNGIMVGQTSIIVGTEYTVVVSFGELLTPLLEIQIESCDIGTMRVIENASVVSKFSDMVSLAGHVPSGVAEMERAIAFDFRAFVIENETSIEVSCELSMVPTEEEETTTGTPLANY